MRANLRGRTERLLNRVWFPDRGDTAARIAGLALAPLAWLTARVAASRGARVRRQAPGTRPAVVVIGNLVVGGTGKTPATIATALALAARGWRVGLLAGGYRARLREPRMVRADADPIVDGDEPVLLATETGLPVAAGRSRGEALALLCREHSELDVVVSDDGLQHPGLARTVEIAVFDGRGAGNGRLLPAGPLREPLERTATIDALLLNGTSSAPSDVRPAFRFDVEPTGFRSLAGGHRLDCAGMAERVRGVRVAALAGIGAPERFFATLGGLGLTFSEHPLGDHADFDGSTLARIDADWILMTTKDAVKCRDFADDRCWALETRAAMPPAFIAWLEERLSGRTIA